VSADYRTTIRPTNDRLENVVCLPGSGTREARLAAISALRRSICWGVLTGLLCAALPLPLWWLPPATVYAVTVAAIATIYIGFAVADGRVRVLVAEVGVATGFIVLAAIALGGPRGAMWLNVAGLVGHGLKDLWQHRTHFVRNTRWWPPFCATVDLVEALVITAVAVIS
jgi:hypothetical protein